PLGIPSGRPHSCLQRWPARGATQPRFVASPVAELIVPRGRIGSRCLFFFVDVVLFWDVNSGKPESVAAAPVSRGALEAERRPAVYALGVPTATLARPE